MLTISGRKRKLTNFLGTFLAVTALTSSAIVGAQATTPIDVAGQAGNFSESFVGVVSVSAQNGVLTFTTNVNHQYFAGDKITTTGFSTAGFNIVDAIVATVPSATTFTVTSNATGTTSAGLAIKRVIPRVFFSSLSGDGTTVTVVAENHGLSVGQTFQFQSGLHNYPYGDKKVASVPDANTFTFASNVNTTESTGELILNLIGVNFPVDSPIYFRNVFSSNGTNVHVRITLTAQDRLDNSGTVRILQNSPSDPSNAKFLNSSVSFAGLSNDSDAFAEFTILYFTGSPTNAQSNPATIRNATISVYDVDGKQYTTITDVKTVEPLAINTILTASGQSGTVKFQSSSTGVSGNNSFTRGRATVVLEDVSTFKLSLGYSDSDSEGAAYITDMSSGIRVVAFNANGGSGSMDSQSASTSTALTSNSFTRTGFNFAGWNTLADGTGTSYANGASFPFTANTTLFAQWTSVAVDRTVTFDANGGSGTMASQTASASTALTANAFTRAGFVFTGWNTQADGSGSSFSDGASFPFSANATLYAQWGNPPAPAPFSGPIPMSTATIPTQSQTEATLTGERLNLITGATVNGKLVTLKPISPTSKGLVFPALPAGTYDVVFTYVGGGTVIQQSGLRVTAASLTQTPIKGAPFTITQRFTGYRGDRGPVVARDLRAITAFIKANPGLTSVTCTGSTSGVPAKSTDQALATARATNACNIVKRLVPGVTTSISTITGQGVGQFHRAVIITGQGTRP